jgi:hypothetical protein
MNLLIQVEYKVANSVPPVPYRGRNREHPKMSRNVLCALAGVFR